MVITLSVLKYVLYYRVVLRSSKYVPNIKIGGDGCLTSGRFLSKAQVFELLKQDLAVCKLKGEGLIYPFLLG